MINIKKSSHSPPLEGLGEDSNKQDKNEGEMPKMKTKSSAKKRFKLTGSGKLKRKHAFKSHILTKKSKKRKLKLTHATLVHKSDEANIKQQLNLK